MRCSVVAGAIALSCLVALVAIHDWPNHPSSALSSAEKRGGSQAQSPRFASSQLPSTISAALYAQARANARVEGPTPDAPASAAPWKNTNPTLSDAEARARLDNPDYQEARKDNREARFSHALQTAARIGFSPEETEKYLDIVEEQEAAVSALEDQVELTRGLSLRQRMLVLGTGYGLPEEVMVRARPTYLLDRLEAELGAKRLQDYRDYIHRHQQ